MIHFSTNIYAKCLPLLVKHDPLCEEGDHLEEEKGPFSRYVFTEVSCKMLFFLEFLSQPNMREHMVFTRQKHERDMVFTRQ